MTDILKQHPGTTITDHLDKEIFSKSTYASCRKAFRQALLITLEENNNNNNNNTEEEEEEEDEDEDIRENIKGAGLHSLRADFATRTLNILTKITEDRYIPLQITAQLLGHRFNTTVIYHYLNLGNNFNANNNDINSIIQKHHHQYSHNNDCCIEEKYKDEAFLFQDLKCGNVVKNEFKKRFKSRSNLQNLANVFDNNYIIQPSPYLPPPPPQPQLQNPPTITTTTVLGGGEPPPSSSSSSSSSSLLFTTTNGGASFPFTPSSSSSFQPQQQPLPPPPPPPLPTTASASSSSLLLSPPYYDEGRLLFI